MARFCCGCRLVIKPRTCVGAALFVELLFKFGGGANAGQLFGLIFAAALAFALEAQIVQGTIAGHGQQPGQKRSARRIVLCGIAPQLQEHVLNNFFRGARLLHDAQHQAETMRQWRS
jgi:hypothetical protein